MPQVRYLRRDDGVLVISHYHKATYSREEEPILNDKRIYVERRPQGDYAVRRPNSERASDVLPTQREAIYRARELSPGSRPDVERVRHTKAGSSDKWRKA